MSDRDDPRRMPDPYPVDLHEVRARELHLFAECGRCRYVFQRFDAALDAMIVRHGNMTLVELAGRARCRHCYHRGAMTVYARIPVTSLYTMGAASWTR